MYKHHIEAHSHNHCCCGKAVSVTYSVCVSGALVIQHTRSMPYIIFSTVACLAIPYFFTLSRQRNKFGRKLLTKNVCFDRLYNFRLKHS